MRRSATLALVVGILVGWAAVLAGPVGRVLVVRLLLSAISGPADDVVIGWLGVASGLLIVVIGAGLLRSALRRMAVVRRTEVARITAVRVPAAVLTTMDSIVSPTMESAPQPDGPRPPALPVGPAQRFPHHDHSGHEKHRAHNVFGSQRRGHAKPHGPRVHRGHSTRPGSGVRRPGAATRPDQHAVFRDEHVYRADVAGHPHGNGRELSRHHHGRAVGYRQPDLWSGVDQHRHGLAVHHHRHDHHDGHRLALALLRRRLDGATSRRFARLCAVTPVVTAAVVLLVGAGLALRSLLLLLA
jgi:hypothetical protein